MPQLLEAGDLVIGSRLEQQVQLEVEAIRKGVKRYRKLVEEATARGEAASLKPVERLIAYWFPEMVREIEREQEAIRAGKSGQRRGQYGPLVLTLDAERVAVVTLHTLLSRCLLNPSGDLAVRNFYAIGNALVAEIHADFMRKDRTIDFGKIERRYRRMTPTRINRYAKRVLQDPVWTRRGCVHAGAALAKIATHCCLVARAVKGKPDEYVPAFEHVKVWHNRQLTGAMRITETASEIIEDGHDFRSTLRPRFLPMVVQPYPWKPDVPGGYIRVRTPMIAKPTQEQTDAIGESDCSDLFEAINALSSTEWVLNQKVLKVMREVWDSGGGVGKMPSADLEPLPPKPAGIEDSSELLKVWKAEAHTVHSANAKARGARAEFVQMLAVADVVGEDGMFLPHQIDFRTRFYPIPLHLNHHGNDLPRSLMLFANRRPLTDQGRRWLLINAANHYGHDKLPFDLRVTRVMEMKKMIREVCRDPLGTIEWWSKAENPWQFLASCFSLTDDSIGERMPVQVDGTCNGTQHYCAAARDQDGGTWVNLIPGDEPRDAYVRVLREVMSSVSKDSDPLAKSAATYLDRKLVKQPVMTSNYNVTMVGMRAQIRGTLESRGCLPPAAKPLASYLVKQVQASLEGVFPGPQQTMRWIEDCAKRICSAYETASIRWTTPLGMVAVQPYRRNKIGRVETAMQSVSVATNDDSAPVAKVKQRQGLPPNIVHSWDAGHLGATAIEMRRRGRDFAGVHDSDWTHAEDVDEMRGIIQQKFIELHEADQLERLRSEWSARYPRAEIQPPPSVGTLDLQEIRNSEYFFH